MNKTLLTLLGSLLYIAGGIAAIYVGVWICFIGGIVGIIDAVKGSVGSMDLAINIAKVVLSGPAGTLASLVFILPGAYCLDKGDA